MRKKKKVQGTSKGGGQKKSRAMKPKVEVPVKLEPVPKPEEEAAKVAVPVAKSKLVADTAFPADKPDYIRMYCNRCGRRLTLKSLHPETPGLGPYQGYCRRPCAVEYIVQVNLLG